MKKLIYLFVFALLFSFCKNGKKKDATDSTKPVETTPAVLSFVKDSLILRSDLCNNDNEMECAEVELRYCRAADGEEKVRNEINAKIETILSNMFFSGDEKDAKGKDFKKAARAFIKDYEDYLIGEGVENIITPHSNESECKILFESSEVACLSFSNWSYTGGAHGNSFTRLVNFNKKTGAVIQTDEILKDKNQLSPILEKIARQRFEVGKGKSLKDVGFYYESENFPVNDNIGILKDSIILEYDPYEVAPYVMGGITFTIAKSEIQELLQPLNVER